MRCPLHLISTLSIAIISFILLSNCSSTLQQTGIPQSGTYKRELNIKAMGVRRSYLIHIPKGYRQNDSIPLVIVLHGGFSNAKAMERETNFSALADRENFIVGYPNGAYGILGFLNHWNAGHCCGKAASDNRDDLGFIEAVIIDVKKRFAIDSNRIYITGFSNGGMLAYYFASERSDLIAAAAPLGASIGGKPSGSNFIWIINKPKFPVPIICFHGTADLNVPYNGGRGQKTRGTREYLSVKRSMEFWQEANNCQEHDITETLCSGRVVRSRWEDLTGEYPVILYTLKDWGHRWPGKYFTNQLKEDDPLVGFDATELIWQFFKKHRRE